MRPIRSVYSTVKFTKVSIHVVTDSQGVARSTDSIIAKPKGHGTQGDSYSHDGK